MIYVSDGRDTHLAPRIDPARSLCGDVPRGMLLNTDGSGPVTCPACLTIAEQAFRWTLMHFRDDVQSKAGVVPHLPLGRVTVDGRAVVTPHAEHTAEGPADCPRCGMLRDWRLSRDARSTRNLHNAGTCARCGLRHDLAEAARFNERERTESRT